MVEIHHIRREVTTTVSAGHAPKIAEEFHGFLLPRPNAGQLLLSMGAVVGDVIRVLVAFSHASQLEHLFTSCQ